MAPSTARTRAQSHFTSTEARDSQLMAEIARDRVAGDVKTAKLRALRLAKEEEDRIAQAEEDLRNPPKPKRKAASRAKAPAA